MDIECIFTALSTSPCSKSTSLATASLSSFNAPVYPFLLFVRMIWLSIFCKRCFAITKLVLAITTFLLASASAILLVSSKSSMSFNFFKSMSLKTDFIKRCSWNRALYLSVVAAVSLRAIDTRPWILFLYSSVLCWLSFTVLLNRSCAFSAAVARVAYL